MAEKIGETTQLAAITPISATLIQTLRRLCIFCFQGTRRVLGATDGDSRAHTRMDMVSKIASTMPGSPGISASLDELETSFEQQGDAELVAQVQKLRADPTALALLALISLSVGFGVTTGFATAGGALGAKVLEDG